MTDGTRSGGPEGADAEAKPAYDEFRALAESYIDPLFYACDGIVQWISPSIASTLGWTASEMRATALTDLVHADDRLGLEALLGRATSGRPGRGVFRLRSKGGGFLWVLVSLANEKDPTDVEAVVGSLREIDLRVETERRLNMIAEHVSDVVYVADERRRVTWVTPSVTRVLGWAPEELIGSVMADLMHPDDRPTVERAMDRALAGLAVQAPPAERVLRMRAKDGGYRWMSATTSPVSGEGTRGVVGGFQDVDELVRARNTITLDAQRLRAILDSLLDPHSVLGPVRNLAGEIVDFVFTDINEVGIRSMGRSKADIVGSRLTSLLPGVAANGLLSCLRDAMESGVALLLEDFHYPGFEVSGSDRRFDIRAIRVEESLSLILRDVTARQLAVEGLSASEEQYRLLAENSTDVVIRLRDAIMLWVSPSVSGSLGWTPEDLVGRSIADFVHVDDVPAYRAHRDSVDEGAHVVGRLRLRARDLSYHWVEVHAAVYVDAAGERDGHVLSFRVVDKEVAAEALLERRARFDDLTGLLNRKEALERIAALKGHRPRSGSATAALFCDIDRFKEVNDRYGHAAGDALLREIAQRVMTSIRARDIAARVGGDELLVVLDGVHDLADAVEVAEKVRRSMALPFVIGSDSLSATLSIGVTLARDGESVDELVARADDAMYRAKQGGRNRVIAIDDAGG